MMLCVCEPVAFDWFEARGLVMLSGRWHGSCSLYWALRLSHTLKRRRLLRFVIGHLQLSNRETPRRYENLLDSIATLLWYQA